eukprot:63294-Rhodomonas_salina.1
MSSSGTSGHSSHVLWHYTATSNTSIQRFSTKCTRKAKKPPIVRGTTTASQRTTLTTSTTQTLRPLRPLGMLCLYWQSSGPSGHSLYDHAIPLRYARRVTTRSLMLEPGQ